MSKKKRRSGKRAARENTSHTIPRPDTRASETRSKPPSARKTSSLDNWLIGLAIAGMVLTLYLTLVAWFGDRPAFCGADSECDLVQQSRWSVLLGLPIAFWGFLTYALLGRLLWRLRTRPSSWQSSLTVASVGAGVSWYLTAVSVFDIEATCGYCLLSFAIINAILLLLLLRRPAHVTEHAWMKSLPVPAVSTVVIVALLFMHFSGYFNPASGPEKPYLKGLAMHLGDINARFYGAYWCPACNDQKDLFEASAGRLPYVECTPEGRNGALSFTCVANEIREYPTWIINGQRYTGVVTTDRLATLSRFRWAGDDAAKQ